jgi:hypothetical protein
MHLCLGVKQNTERRKEKTHQTKNVRWVTIMKNKQNKRLYILLIIKKVTLVLKVKIISTNLLRVLIR